jgi:para-nitrobenzyl esterase
MQAVWITFAKTGNPSCKTIDEWPQYGKDRKTMIIGKNSHIESALYEEERAAWDIVK